MLRLALCFSLLLAATPAWSQTSSPPVSASPSQAQIDAATDLLKASNAAANMSVAMDTLLPIEAAALKREHPNADDSTIRKLQEVVRDTIKAHQDEMLQIYAIAYAQHFTIDELHTLSAFYRSDVGQKYVREIPGLMKEVAPLGISHMQSLITQAIQDAIQHMRAQGEKI